MAQRWTDKPLNAGLADDDLLLVGDVSLAEGSRDTTVEVATLRSWLQTGLTEWGTITGTLAAQTDLWNALQAAQSTPIKPVTFTSDLYTLQTTDAFSLLTVAEDGYSVPPTMQVRIPTNAAVAFAIGVRLEVARIDSGVDAATVSITAASGVTLIGNGAATLTTGDLRTLIKIGADTWLLA